MIRSIMASQHYVTWWYDLKYNDTLGKMNSSIRTLRVTTLSIMTLSIIRIVTLSIMVYLWVRFMIVII